MIKNYGFAVGLLAGIIATITVTAMMYSPHPRVWTFSKECIASDLGGDQFQVYCEH